MVPVSTRRVHTVEELSEANRDRPVPHHLAYPCTRLPSLRARAWQAAARRLRPPACLPREMGTDPGDCVQRFHPPGFGGRVTFSAMRRGSNSALASIKRPSLPTAECRARSRSSSRSRAEAKPRAHRLGPGLPRLCCGAVRLPQALPLPAAVSVQQRQNRRFYGHYRSISGYAYRYWRGPRRRCSHARRPPHCWSGSPPCSAPRRTRG